MTVDVADAGRRRSPKMKKHAENDDADRGGDVPLSQASADMMSQRSIVKVALPSPS
jgi:hypothetical protein